MAKTSSGVILYRWMNGPLEVFLVHSGGPFWQKKELQGLVHSERGTRPRGGFAPGCATRIQRETGFRIDGDFEPLSSIRQSGGKLVHAWAVEGNCNPKEIESNTFEMEWPPNSGWKRVFPEVDRAAWFSIEEARARILPSQWPLIAELSEKKGRA